MANLCTLPNQVSFTVNLLMKTFFYSSSYVLLTSLSLCLLHLYNNISSLFIAALHNCDVYFYLFTIRPLYRVNVYYLTSQILHIVIHPYTTSYNCVFFYDVIIVDYSLLLATIFFSDMKKHVTFSFGSSLCGG